MKDKIDERDFQERLNNSVIKSYNVHYITVEEAAQAIVKIGENVNNAEFVPEAVSQPLNNNTAAEEDLPPSAFYGMVDPDEETINRMQEIMKDREAAVKAVFDV